MARGRKTEINELGEQLILSELCLNTRNNVVQSNTLVMGKQDLSLNATKLIRCAIMQVVKEDEELKPYRASVQDLAEMFGVSSSNLYRDIEKVTKEVSNKSVEIRQIGENGKTDEYIGIPWVSICRYKADVGVVIELNPKLKPFLTQLANNYTIYSLDNVLPFKSVYSIRLFEMIQSKIYGSINTMPKQGKTAILTVKEIRECCGCEDKYDNFGSFKRGVVDAAVKEINEYFYRVDYRLIKESRSVVAIEFHINNIFNVNRNSEITSEVISEIPTERKKVLDEKITNVKKRVALAQAQ